MAFDAREAAFKALGAFRRNGAWPEAFLNNLIKSEGLNELDAALATRLCYGVLQNKALLDYYIGHFSSLKAGKIEPAVFDILELSSYQLLFMDKIPASAAVNEAVKLTKKTKNQRASGFVNAVLRKISQNNGKLPEISGKTNEETLAIKYSHPLKLINMLSGFMSLADLEGFLKANNEEAPQALQVNTLKADFDSVFEALSNEGSNVTKHPWIIDCLLVKNIGRLENSRAFYEGLFSVQDVSSRLSVMAANPQAGQSVYDTCSAPGGKAFMVAILMGDKGEILASDIHENKLPRILEGAKRLGISIIETSQIDASEAKEELFEKFDLVIADVPCSGLGIIRKKPEIRYKELEEIKGLPALQSKIIDNVSRYVKPGGVLMYSTCTIVPDENEGVVKAFISRNVRFKAESFTLPEPIGEVSDGMITLYPHVHGTDGFFMCKMRKA